MEEKKERKSIINELFSKSYFKTLELLKLVFLVAIIEFVIIIFQAVINYQISSRYTNTPFIVMVDNKTKDILNVRVIEDDKIDKDIIQEKQIENKLSEIITMARSIPTDKAFYQKNLDRIQAYFTREAGDQLKESLKSNQVTEKLNNRESVTVEINSVIRLEKRKRKYQVMWTENYMKLAGDIIVKKYTAVIDVILVDVKGNEMLRDNPFGIMIKDINISELITKEN
jgi:type IV secretory pathway TrbF-like protein